jgi:hypothetical protein
MTASQNREHSHFAYHDSQRILERVLHAVTGDSFEEKMTDTEKKWRRHIDSANTFLNKAR